MTKVHVVTEKTKELAECGTAPDTRTSGGTCKLKEIGQPSISDVSDFTCKLNEANDQLDADLKKQGRALSEGLTKIDVINRKLHLEVGVVSCGDSSDWSDRSVANRKGREMRRWFKNPYMMAP